MSSPDVLLALPTSLPTTSVAGATLGPPPSQYTISWANVQAQPTSWQAAEGIVDSLYFYNESGVGFNAQMNNTKLSFPMPAGAWMGPIPATTNGISDTSITLTAQSLLSGGQIALVQAAYLTPSKIVPDWGAHVLGNSPVGISGPITVTSIITALLELTGTDTWTVTQDGAGNLDVTDTVTGDVYVMARGGTLTVPGGLLLGTGLTLSSGAATITSASNANKAINAMLPSAPAADTTVISTAVTADTNANRASLYIRGADGFGGLRSGAGTSIAAHLYAQTGGWQTDEAFVGIGGQATAGSFGMPLTIQQVTRQAYSSGSQINLISFTPSVVGSVYRISAYVACKNAGTITMTLRYTDPDAGAQITTVIVNNTASLVAATSLATSANQVLAMVPIEFLATTSAAINLVFQDTHATPSDVLTATLERIA